MIRLIKAILSFTPVVLAACVHQPRPSCELNLQPINLPVPTVTMPAPVVSEPPLALPTDPGEQ